MTVRRFGGRVALSLVALSGVVGCGGGEENASAQEAPMVEAIQKVERRPDGRFDVTCDDGRIEVVTADQIRDDEVCGGPSRPTTQPPHENHPTARFVCMGGTLQVAVLANSGGEQTAKFVTLGGEACTKVAEMLKQNRRVIHRMMLIGVCRQGGGGQAPRFLERVSITAAGVVQTLPAVPFFDDAKCEAAANALNAPIAASPHDGAIGTFACSRLAELEISVVGASGKENTAKLSTLGSPRCQPLADALNSTRRDLTRTMTFGACDFSNVLQGFSVTISGDLQPLSPARFGDAAACNAEAAELNR